ncbi:MAG: hypothetical protein PVG79_13890 [Gemmatimonadales bacterium]|jgi:hypothetical protein
MRTHRIALLTVLAASALTASCAEAPSGFPEVEGWTQAGEVRIYTADDLWEYIDGAATLFVEYGVRTCMTADMSAPGASVTVDLYEMGSPLRAVGVFKREAAGRGEHLTGTTVAALSPPYQALMVKGSTYVKVNAYEGELSEPAGRRLLQGLAASLPGETVIPQEFSLLPEEGKVPGSEGYQPGSLLGLEELTECVYADYEGRDGESWEGFVVLSAAAPDVWEALADRWQSIEHDGLTILFREVPYSGLVGVTRTDAEMFGVSGAADQTQLRERLAVFASLR